MVYDPNLGNLAWPGGPPLGAVAAMAGYGVVPAAWAEAAQAEAKRAEELRRAKEAIRASGVTCEIQCPKNDTPPGYLRDARARRLAGAPSANTRSVSRT
jgi:hypothetical protein